MKRVVITGIGAVTPLGNSFERSWQGVLSGRSGISGITRFDASGLPWAVAGEIRDFDAGTFLSVREMRRLDLFAQYAAASAMMAAQDSGLLDQSGGVNSRFSESGIVIGSSRGGIGTIEKALSAGGTKAKRISPYVMPATTINMAASYSAMKLGISGYCLGISNACASGANAIGEAYRLIMSGYNAPVFAGGAEAPVCRICVEGYGAAGALSRRQDPSASRPFSSARDGFVLSEGASVLVLEGLESALERGAGIYGEVIGYGSFVDAFHQTKPDPAGEAKAIMASFKDSGIMPGDVDYINAHGTSTRIGDIAEAEAIRQVFGDRAETIPCSATKSVTGHMIAASGSFEAACTVMALRDGVVPPSINLDEQDPLCRLRIITERTVISPEIALTSSFGFGGVNAVLLLRKYV